MKIGVIYGFHKYKPKAGGDVHFYQLVKNLHRLGNDICVFEWNYHPDAIVYKYSKWNLLKFLYEIDALYVRITLGYTDRYILLKLLRMGLPLVWEINAPFEEYRIIRNDNDDRTFLAEKVSFLCNAAVAVSKKVRDFVRDELDIQDVIVVENGSDVEMFCKVEENRENDSGVNIFWMGSSKYKWHGLDKIMQLADRLHGDKRFKFTLLCDPNYVPNELKDRENVTIVGEVDYLDMPKYLMNADICLALYDINYYAKFRYGFYGSPLKLFDYMAAGKAVIATKAGQIEEVIKDGENGLLTDNSIEDLERKIELLMKSKELGMQLGEKARQSVVDYYNWNRAAKQTEDLILRLVNKNKR